MNSIFCAGAGCALLLLGASPGSAATFTLGEAMAVAYETNPQLDAARSGQKATDEAVAQAEANWRPSVNLQGSYGYETLSVGSGFNNRSALTLASHPLTAGVQLAQNIYRGGRTAAEISKAKALVRAGVAQLSLTEEGVLLDAVTAYMNMVRDQATVRYQQDNVAALQKQLDASQEEFKVGELTRTDVAQSRARLADAQANLVNAQGELGVSRSNFEHVIGRPPETLEQNPPLPKLPSTEDQAVSIGLHENPAIVAANESAKAADYAVVDATGALLPTVSLNAQYQLSQDSLESTEGTGVQHITSVIGQVTIPIYQGGAEESAVRQAKDQRSQAEIEIADTQRQAVAATQTAWQAYTVAKGSIASDEIAVNANQEAFDGVKAEQQVGSRTVLDVLNAQQELLTAQIALVSAERDAQVAAYQMLSALGWLTAKKLALRVQLYDPSQNYKDNATRWFGFGD
ncbi:MAG TPA: TolC family outer membrane protein [Rhizomicrobium sp.]|nr:TolC family outer membrane protein [Rhizomicrobium sp.]